MSDHRLEWSPAPKPLPPEIAAAVDTVEARLVGFDGFGAAIHEQVIAEERLPLTPCAPLINARDIYLAGFAWDDIKQMYREVR